MHVDKFLRTLTQKLSSCRRWRKILGNSFEINGLKFNCHRDLSLFKAKLDNKKVIFFKR